jgi:hypothetical protein
MKVMTVESDVLEITWDARVISFAKERGLCITRDTYPHVYSLYIKQLRHKRLRDRIRKLEARAAELDEEICQDFKSYRRTLLTAS